MKPAKALAQAASVGDLKTMRTMMKQAPSLAVEWQPIMDACFAGQAEAVELLLECGADPNISSKSAHHYRPLHRTVEYKKPFPKHPGHCTVVDLLLNAGADPTQRGSYWLISAIALCACGDAREFLPAMLKALRRSGYFPRKRSWRSGSSKEATQEGSVTCRRKGFGYKNVGI